ncbi:MAG TPA: phage terminase large subunit family protein [bacterium]|nr:phage terminase large subunit family protein [bacterium]HQJ66390.1 phage terminase large subunit family protein [bacterium]
MRPLPLNQTHCLEVLATALAPRRALTVSQWSDAHRELSGKQAGERGRWRTARNPILREIMDAMSASSRVTDIWVIKSSQVGVTEATVNFLGYTMDHAPAPVMVLMPTLDSRDAWKAQKLNPLLQETPVIRDLLGGQRSRDAANSKDMIDFPGGVLFLAGGNSPNSYAQRSVRFLIMDDLDRFPPEVGEEGDPVALAKGRTKAFARAKRLFISTPTVKGMSLIERGHATSDQRRYHIPCPHCGHYQPLEWGGPEAAHGIKYLATETGLTAWYVCVACSGEIHEHHKPAFLAAGRWIATHPERSTRGYHISALYAPIGLGPSWRELVEEWKVAVKSPGTLRTFVNTHLGECWEEQGDQIEPVGLLARLEDYDEKSRSLARTGGVDVQKDRLEASIVDWDAGEEAWVMEHLIIPGDTAQPEVWGRLDEELSHWAPEFVAIDSGYNTSMVYAFVEKRRWAVAVKGRSGGGVPIVEDEKARRQRLRRQRKKGITVHLVGDDQAKALIYSRLKITEPGPGYIHFPNDPSFDDEYFAQLTAEKLVTKMRGTRPYVEWVQTRPRNETLDCLKYNLAALRLSGIDLKLRAARQYHRLEETPPPVPAMTIAQPDPLPSSAAAAWEAMMRARKEARRG